MSPHPWSPDVRDIGDRIASLTVARAAELHRYLEKVHGITVAAVPVVERVRVEPTPLPPPAPTEFRVVLERFEPARKINVIRVVRELTALGLKEAKDLVEGAPRVVKEGVSAEEAAQVKARLEDAGATVSVAGITA